MSIITDVFEDILNDIKNSHKKSIDAFTKVITRLEERVDTLQEASDERADIFNDAASELNELRTVMLDYIKSYDQDSEMTRTRLSRLENWQDDFEARLTKGEEQIYGRD